VNFLDTAPYYGHGLSEARIGRYIAEHPGHGLAISTKVGRRLDPCRLDEVPDCGFVRPLPFRPVFDFSRDGVLRAFDDSLARLGVDRVDTLLLHDIGAHVHGTAAGDVLEQALDEALPAMWELKTAGAARAIGLGVNEWQVCDEVLAHTDIDTVLLAGRYSLLDQSALPFLDRASARGVSVMAAGVFNSGLLAGGTTYDYAPADAALVARRDCIEAICARHGVPLPAAAIRFAQAHPAVERVVIGWRSAREVEQAVAWSRTAISADLWRELAAEELIPAGAPIPC
jgi:D-threo-aldose 1-dehydrogenase